MIFQYGSEPFNPVDINLVRSHTGKKFLSANPKVLLKSVSKKVCLDYLNILNILLLLFALSRINVKTKF